MNSSFTLSTTRSWHCPVSSKESVRLVRRFRNLSRSVALFVRECAMRFSEVFCFAAEVPYFK